MFSFLPTTPALSAAQAALTPDQIAWVVTEKLAIGEVPQGYSCFGMGYSGTHNFTEFKKGRCQHVIIQVEGLGFFKAREMSYAEGDEILAARRARWMTRQA